MSAELHTTICTMHKSHMDVSMLKH